MIFISDEIEKLCGWPAEDFIGLEPKRNYISIIHPEDQQMVSDIIFEAVNERRPYSIEYRIITSEDKMHWVFERGQAVHEENGDAAYLDGTIIDITARKNAEFELAKYRGHLEELVAIRTSSLEEEVAAHQRTEQELADKSKDLDDFFSLSTDILLIVGNDRIVTRISPSWTKILGHNEEMVTGRSVYDFAHPDDVTVTMNALQEALAKGGCADITVRVRRLDGNYRIIEWHVATHGTSIYAVGHDVTNRKAIEQALHDNEEMFRTVFERSPIGMALLRRPSMDCVDVNETMMKLIGLTKPQSVGQTPQVMNFFVTKKDIDEAEEICKRGLPKRNELMQFRRADGVVLNVAMSCEPLRTSKGEFMLVFCMPGDNQSAK